MPYTHDINRIRYNAAIDEIKAVADLPIQMDTITAWVQEYTPLWDELKRDLAPVPVPIDIIHERYQCEFYSIYGHFYELVAYHGLEHICSLATREYDGVMAENSALVDNIRLINWLKQYEHLGAEQLITPPIEMADDLYNEKEIYEITYTIPRSEFANVMAFYRIFSDLYWRKQLLPESIEAIQKEMDKMASNAGVKGGQGIAHLNL